MSSKLIVSAAAAARAAAPVAAQAAPERLPAPTAAQDEHLFGPVVLPFLIAIVVAIGIWLAVDNGDDPVSP